MPHHCQRGLHTVVGNAGRALEELLAGNVRYNCNLFDPNNQASHFYFVMLSRIDEEDEQVTKKVIRDLEKLLWEFSQNNVSGKTGPPHIPSDLNRCTFFVVDKDAPLAKMLVSP